MPRCWGVAALACCVLVGGCSDAGLEFADWSRITPGADTPVFEYAAVGTEAREGAVVEVVEDLVIGDDASDPEQVFYGASGVAVDADGSIYVLDRGAHRVQVFDAEGTYLRTLGQEGQGPGEFASPSNLTIASGHVILKAASRRLSVWSLAGEHVRDVQLTRLYSSFAGSDAGFVASYRVRPPPSEDMQDLETPYFASLFDAFGDEQSVFAELVEPPMTTIDLGGGGFLTMSGGMISDFSPRFVVSPRGRVHLTTSTEYQIHTLGADPWSLRVAWERQAVTAGDVDATMSRMDSPLFDELDESAFSWPDRFSAISAIEVDGHGHLFVFPFFAPLNAPIGPDEERPEIARPVDVYSASGEHLFSGLMDVWSWSAYLGDFVYTTRTNPLTEEVEVVRYRLVEPF